MRLLLIEDEPRLAGLIASYLRTAGFVVDIANRLSDAAVFLADPVFDAILLDRGLPDGDGLQFLQTLRRCRCLDACDGANGARHGGCPR